MIKVSKKTASEFETILLKRGKEYFYSRILASAISALTDKDSDVILLDQAEGFFSLFRTTGNTNMFEIGQLLRRAAHSVYRYKCKKKPSSKNPRFLQLV